MIVVIVLQKIAVSIICAHFPSCSLFAVRVIAPRIAFPLNFDLLTDVSLISQRRRRFQPNLWIASDIQLFDECVGRFDIIQQG